MAEHNFKVGDIVRINKKLRTNPHLAGKIVGDYRQTHSAPYILVSWPNHVQASYLPGELEKTSYWWKA